MSDELVTVPPAEGGSAAGGGGGEEKKVRPHLEIQKRVAEALAASGPQLLKAVEKALEDQTQERRKNAILKMIDKLGAADKELSKMMAQGVQSYGPNLEKLGAPVFTKQQVQDIRLKKEEIQKFENALNAAIGEKLDFQKLFELTGENK